MSRKAKFIIVIGVLIIMVVGTLLEKIWNETPQHKAFVENKGVGLSDDETKFIEKFYSDLAVIYSDYKLADRSGSFNNIAPREEGDSRHIRLMTVDLLDAVCDSNHVHNSTLKFSRMNSSMGTSSFRKYIYSRNWDRSFWSDLQYLYEEKYFAIVEGVSIESPELNNGDDHFTSGTIAAHLVIYDLSSLKIVSVSQILAENSDNIEFKRYSKIEAQEKVLNKDLSAQFRRALDQTMKVRLDID